MNSHDLKADKSTLKGLSLFGHQGGPVSVIDSADGKITRIRPLDFNSIPSFKDITPWKIEARGKTFSPPDHTVYSFIWQSYKKRVYSKNRVCYPLKRVDWDPNGERNPQNRGKSPYVRISWDEAAKLIADELLRVKEKYGMSAVLSEADMHAEGKHVEPAHGCMNRLLSLLGGYTVQMRNNDSWEGWHWGSKNVWGSEPVGQMQPSGNLWPDIAQNSELLLFWGCDAEVTPLGIQGMMSSRLCYWLTELGIKCVYVCPDLNYAAAVHADKWIPVLPNTDAALHLAICYVWLTEGTYNKEYVETHCVGYQEFFDYVLGKEDGEPKTPAWASEKCGVPTWTIKALARDWASKATSTVHGNGGPGIRGPYSTEPARLEAILLSMQGLGGPGRHQAKMIEWQIHSDVYPMPYQPKIDIGRPVFAEITRPPHSMTDRGTFNYWPDGIMERYPRFAELYKIMDNPPNQEIPRCLVHEAILSDHIEWYGLDRFIGPREEQFHKHEFPEPGCSKIHMIWTDAPCNVTCWNNGFRFVEALRSNEIECVVAQHPWLENDCYMADIILPITTKVEQNDVSEDAIGGTYVTIYRERPACPPVGESVSDYEAVCRVAKALGGDYYEKYTVGADLKELIEQAYYGYNVEDLCSYEDFEKKEILFLQPDLEIQQKAKPGLRQFYEDPASMPLNTPTGKLEFTSTALKEHFPDDEERPPYPKWIEKGVCHDESLSGERAKKYPLVCMSNHGRWRMHAQCDDITWTREIETMKIRAKDGYQYEPVWMHTSTAAERGIKHGDIVKVFNERGIVLAGAYVTERLIPGVAYMDHGSRFDPIDAAGIDRGGAINLITPKAITSKNATGMVVSGFLVDVQKVSDAEMEAWKKQYPESFARKVDEACGVCLDGWMLE